MSVFPTFLSAFASQNKDQDRFSALGQYAHGLLSFHESAWGRSCIMSLLLQQARYIAPVQMASHHTLPVQSLL